MRLSDYSVTAETIGAYEEIFENVSVWDCHMHVGRDLDGSTLTAAQLVRQMDAYGVDRGVVFPLNDPRDSTHFVKPNDEIWKAYQAHPKRIIPFMRLNPKAAWQKEFEKRRKQGFLGLKLHPRSQDFPLVSKKAMPLYGTCEHYQMPLLMHVGFGLESVADDLLRVVTTFPKLKLIIGHAGFVDLDNVIKKVGRKPNVLFDTSTCKIFDLYELFRRVGVERIAFGSDIPYYGIDIALQGVIDTAIALGMKPTQVRRILGGNLSKWFRN